MSWYNEETYGEMKKYLEWCFGEEMIPSTEYLYFRRKSYWLANKKEAEDE